MVLQDSRVTENGLKFMETFFVCVAQNDNNSIRKLLTKLPSLIYARDENGNTVLHQLIGSKPQDLVTLNIILEVLTEVGWQPDLTLTNNFGTDVVGMLNVYRGDPLYNQFGGALEPYMESYYAASAAVLREGADAYFARTEVIEARKAIKKIEDGGGKKGGGSKCTIMSVHEINNDEAYSNIFGYKYNNHFFTIDDQKEMNRFAQFNEEPLPINFDFTPKGFALSSASSNMLPIIVIPSIFEGITIEQIQHYVEKISDYLFNSDIN